MIPQNMNVISGTTKVVALLGHPVAHSLSPAMHNPAFAAAGLDFCYVVLDVRPEEIGAAIRGVRALNFAGINVTVPHKQAVSPLLDELTEEARAIGAVNTAANRDGRWVGTNTDATGFRRLLEQHGLYRKDMKAVMLGAGGAARAGLYVLGQVAREVVVANRTVPRAEELLRTLAPYQGTGRWLTSPLDRQSLAAHMEDADLLVNTTSVGMYPNDELCPLPAGVQIPSHCAVVDMVYAPPKTRLLELAERSGARTVGGRDMLLFQAVEAFQFWTGLEPELRVMDSALGKAS